MCVAKHTIIRRIIIILILMWWLFPVKSREDDLMQKKKFPESLVALLTFVSIQHVELKVEIEYNKGETEVKEAVSGLGLWYLLSTVPFERGND